MSAESDAHHVSQRGNNESQRRERLVDVATFLESVSESTRLPRPLAAGEIDQTHLGHLLHP